MPEVARTCVTIEGSGMGNIHSGEVAGSVFTKKVEIPFLDPDIQEIFDLRGYGRYRDDILVFIGYRTAENFIKAYTKTAEDAGYEVRVDQRDFFKIHYLDINVVRPKDFLTTGKFGYTLYTKETSQKSILSSESGHGWNVHKNWPLGEIRRFGQRNKFYEDYSKCKKHLIRELRAYLFHNSIVKRVEAYDPMITEHKKTAVTVTNVDDSQLAEFFEDMTEQQNIVEGNEEKLLSRQ